MIELPEAYVLSAQIQETIVGKTIVKAVAGASPHKFAWYSGDPEGYGAMLEGKKVTGTTPGTGYTCGGNVEIVCGDMLVVISTPIKYHAPGDKVPPKHQLLLEFDDGSSLTCTVQMWGGMLCYPLKGGEPPEGIRYSSNPTPMTPEFNRDYFRELCRAAVEAAPKLSVKALLATEQRIPGLGNGVLQDILFRARLHPKRQAATLTGEDVDRLFQTVTGTIAEMVEQGGRNTEKDLFNRPGGYQTILSSKTLNDPCPNCLGGITRQAYLGGNVYFCPTCQPL